MTQYAVPIFEGATELAADVLEAHGALPGLALHPSETATAIRGHLITDGPFIETKEALAGVFVIEARDLDHAIALARMTPVVDGGVEVRPLLGFQVLEQS
jgi:hypothetical protein